MTVTDTSISTRFSPNLFWDTDPTTLDQVKHARYIIERVLLRGQLSDWFTMVRLYGLERIKQEAMNIRYLDKTTLNFCSNLFGVPKSKFRCYKQPRSIQQLWPF